MGVGHGKDAGREEKHGDCAEDVGGGFEPEGGADDACHLGWGYARACGDSDYG